jgi:hypothetical protein
VKLEYAYTALLASSFAAVAACAGYAVRRLFQGHR